MKESHFCLLSLHFLDLLICFKLFICKLLLKFFSNSLIIAINLFLLFRFIMKELNFMWFRIEFRWII